MSKKDADEAVSVVSLASKIHEARAFNFTYRYINDVLSINNSRFAEFLLLIYTPELEVKETTDTYISTRSWYRNINFLRDRIRRIFE
jgi:hypothetical protein